MTIRIWADTHSTGVIDELGRALSREETSITEETWTRLQQWVEDYDVIIPLNAERRRPLRATIDALDARGLALMEAIAREWPRDLASGEPTTFRYYSEGRMETLPAG